MKKEANVILAKCKKDQLYGIRIEKRENDWVRTWAFRLQEEMAEKEGFDKVQLTGSFYTDDDYPGCPYGSDRVVCNWCGAGGRASRDDSAMDVTGGGF